MNILLVGSGAREHAVARAIHASKHETHIFCFGNSFNPGIQKISAGYTIGSMTNIPDIVSFAQEHLIDFAFIGPEIPLELGIVDALSLTQIPAIGPSKEMAQIETSKRFTRDLLTKYEIPACPKYRYFSSMDGVENYIKALDGNFVVKVDSLMGGKGVMVSGEHLHSIADGVAWCDELIKQGKDFLIEEKLIGQEFSLMSFSDGQTLVHMPAAQDHKRAFVGDTGPNTGGMGCYSDSDHKLPFLTDSDIEQAIQINEAAARALKNELGNGYKGILYGGFMATKNGVKLIEYNARFGDPECQTILPLLETDFVDLCQAIINEKLDEENIIFAHRAAVCKYAVPDGYPDNPVKNQVIDISNVENKDRLYYSGVNQENEILYETGSRTVAVVAVAGTIAEAEEIAEAEICRISGPLFHRADIGTEENIRTKISMMINLRK